MNQHTNILILGAGIGGYETFRTLNKLLKRAGIKKTITLVDQNNYFTFTPLLHEAASGAVEPDHCAIPIRELIRKTPHHFLKTRVQKILPQEKKVITELGEVSYDYCVVALGSGVNFFGTPGADTFAYTVRTLAAAMRLRTDLFTKIEGCQNQITLTMVGGGYSGIEVAGQFSSLAERDLKRLYPKKSVHVRVIESGTQIVPPLPEKARELVLKRLKKIGIELLLGTAVKEVRADAVTLSNGETLPSDMTIWCAGVKNTANTFLDEDLCEKGKIPVNEFLQQKNLPSLYGVGDIVCGFNAGSNIPFPPLGEAAHKQGQYVARHIVAQLRNNPMKPFHFTSLGMLMPIGERYGVAVLGTHVISGLFAWWLRRTAYLLFMPGLLRKLRIVIDWTLRLFGFGYIIEVGKN